MMHWKDWIARPGPHALKRFAGHVAVMMASAVLLALAFPRPGWGWLAHVALVPAAMLAIHSTSPRMLTLTLWLVCSLWWAWMLRWLMPVTGGGAVGLAMATALYWVAALLLVRHLHKAYRSAMVVTLPLAWVSFELLRGLAPMGGFGWFHLGHTQAPFLPGQSPGLLIQIADVFGQPGVSFLVVMTNGLIVDFLSRPILKPRRASAGRHRRVSRTLTVGVLLWVITMLGAMGHGLLAFRAQERSVTGTLPIAVVQTAIPQSNKDALPADTPPEQLEAHDALREVDWQRLQEMTRQAAAMHPRPAVIIWPETMIPGPINPEAMDYALTDERERIRAWLRYPEQVSFLAADLRVNLVVGASSLTPNWQELRFETANSVFVYDWLGRQSIQRHDKIHRVPFGEYIPWVDNWPWLKERFIQYLSPYQFDYSLTPGKAVVRFNITPPEASSEISSEASPETSPESSPASPADLAQHRPVRLITPICFEDTVPRLVRAMAYDSTTGRKTADVLANLTNDGWFAGTDQPMQHLQIAVFRSIELRLPTARSVNMGVSGFIDSMGRVGPLVEQDGQYQDVTGLAITTVKLDSRATFYGSIGPVGSIVIALVTTILALLGLARRTGSRRKSIIRVR